MRIGAILPHLLVFGGVRRYIELGNAFLARRHEFILFTPDGKSSDWLHFMAEASACGLAVCCTRSGTIDFAVDGKSALVVSGRS